tara:strand:+ start:97 stop:495 length:399 start_codon:yes stop_codon:yes gene_type:complete
MIKKKVPVEERPECITEGCERKRQHLGTYKKDGTPNFRKYCVRCHGTRYGVLGWEYKKHRKDYCENIDSRLGYKCTSTIIDECQLQVDHIDGNHDNNDIKNLQTLCANCHAYKTLLNEDWKSNEVDGLSERN